MKTISKSQLKECIDKKEDMLLINVLPTEEFKKRSIPGSVNIPIKGNADFVKNVAQHTAAKDQRIVVYCAGTQCPLSREAAETLENAGYTNVQAFEEGIEGWFGHSGQAAA